MQVSGITDLIRLQDLGLGIYTHIGCMPLAQQCSAEPQECPSLSGSARDMSRENLGR